MIFRKPRGDPGSLGLHLVAEASLGERPTARICKSHLRSFGGECRHIGS
jgi:hypothetical protein